MKKKLLIGFSAITICAAFWACGTGDIETVGIGDENARDLYGLDPDALDQLVADAKKNCADDPECVAAQENAELIESGDEDVDITSSGAADTTSSASSSPSSSGAITSSGAVVGSSSGTVAGSSAATSSSSGTATSSSSMAKSSSSVYVDPTGKIGGSCKAVTGSIDKGKSTQWVYTRLGPVAPGTYEWTFENGSIETSKDSLTAAVTYATAGIHKATLVVNKGLSNEYKMECSVTVKGEPVKNCVCTNDAKGTVFFKSGSPASVKWSVSGCTGGNTFTYAWGGAATGTEASATASISTAGSVAPTLVVTNEEQGNMNVSCPAVTAEQLLSASCQLSTDQWNNYSSSLSALPGKKIYFKPKSVSGLKDGNTSATLDLKGTDGTDIQVTTKNGDNSTAVSLNAPEKLDNYTYTLYANGIEVCKATLKVEYSSIKGICTPSSTSPLMGDNVTFSVSNQSWSRSDYGTPLTMDIEGAGAAKTTSVSLDYNSPNGFSFKAPTTPGSKTVKLTYKGNEFCSMALNVKKPKITGTCSVSPAQVIPGEKVKFNAGSSSTDWRTDLYGSSLPMTLTGTDGSSMNLTVTKATNSYEMTAPSKAGSYTYTLKYDGDNICTGTLKVNDLSASCSALTAYTQQSLTSGLTVNAPGTYGVPLKVVVGGDSIGGIASCKSGSCAYSIKAPATPGSYDYDVYLNGTKMCSNKLTVNKPVTCSASPATINESQSITFTTNYGGGSGCSSATTTVGDSTLSTGCQTSQTFTPDRAGTFVYKYAAKGTYGDDECSATVTVNAVAPTCAVADLTHMPINFSVNVTPAKVTGCLNDDNGCSYSITGGTAGGASGSNYAGGKITGLTGESEKGSATYTLSLTNGAGTGTCSFNVAYTGADEEITSKGSSISVSSGTIVKISEDLTSGELRCWHGWQNANCTVNIESASTATKTIGNCNSGDGWGYAGLSLTSLNADRLVVITFTGVGDGKMSCGIR